MNKTKIIVVEDNIVYCEYVCNMLSREGYRNMKAYHLSTAKKHLQQATDNDIVVADLRLPDGSGIDLLCWMRKEGKMQPFIIMTDYAEVNTAVESMKLGSIDYIPKQLVEDKLVPLIRSILKERQAGQRRMPVFARDGSAFQKIMHRIRLVAATDMSVMIFGENGTGKEHIAHHLHDKSKRAVKPFVAVDCGSLTKELAPSAFFGHVKGAFTGADCAKKGYFHEAEGGTLFLDEVEGMSPALQIKLLRTLQEREVMRVGGNRIIHVDVRIVAATNEALERKVREGTFRRDLYYRLNTLPAVIPPLTERGDDMFLLMDQFRRELNGDFRLTEPVQDFFRRHTWPGNIRELRNVVEYFIYTDHRDITMEDLPPTLLLSGDALSRPVPAPAARQNAAAPSMSDSFRFVLAQLYAASEAGTPMGRDKLLQKARESHVPLSQQEVRTILSEMSEQGLARVSRGRGGSQLTPKGRELWEIGQR